MSETKCVNEACNEVGNALSGLCWSCAYWVYDRKTK